MEDGGEGEGHALCGAVYSAVAAAMQALASSWAFALLYLAAALMGLLLLQCPSVVVVWQLRDWLLTAAVMTCIVLAVKAEDEVGEAGTLDWGDSDGCTAGINLVSAMPWSSAMISAAMEAIALATIAWSW